MQRANCPKWRESTSIQNVGSKRQQTPDTCSKNCSVSNQPSLQVCLETASVLRITCWVLIRVMRYASEGLSLKAFVSLVLSWMLAMSVGCSGISVRSDFDRTYNFQHLRVYEWLPVQEDKDIRHIDVERVRRAVNKDLKFKGFRLGTGKPDFVIAMSIGTQLRSTVVGDNSGWDRFSGGTSPRSARLVNYEQGTLKLDFIDSKTKKIIWQGEARAVLSERPSPQKVEVRINEAVGKMLRDFPPKNSE
jgi:hypothetical protein